jgi:hypothetical protein
LHYDILAAQGDVVAKPENVVMQDLTPDYLPSRAVRVA